MSRRPGFWPLRDLPVLLWLLATAGVAFVHPFFPAPRWLMIHLLLLGAISHAILVWSRHFAESLLHSPPDDRRAESHRLLLLNGGVVCILGGVVGEVWPLTVAGACAFAGAVAWHGWSLWRQLRGALGSRFAGTVRYYVAAACFLPVGATLGTILARDVADPWHTRLVVAHATVNLLGWVGLTVVGTLVTLWPTILRTRIADGAERAAGHALPLLVTAILVAAGGAVAGSREGTVLGILGYVAGLSLTVGSFCAAMRSKPPVSFPSLSVLAALVWLVGGLLFLAVGVSLSGSWHGAHQVFEQVTPLLAAGFAAQVLLGALSYLIPVALGGGPSPVRAANTVLDRGGPLRVVLVNAGLLLCSLPVPSAVRVLASMLVLAAMVAFLPLVLLAVRASRRAKAESAGASAGGLPRAQPNLNGRPYGQVTGLAGVGLAAVVLAAAAGVAIDPAAVGAGGTASASAEVAATGETTIAHVEANDMRFTPSTIEVPAGNGLVIVVHNTDEEDVHDLVLDSGADTGRLAPGGSARLDVGVVGRDLQGWCAVVGHGQMGMVLHVKVTGSAAPTTDHGHHVQAGPATGVGGGDTSNHMHPTGHDMQTDAAAGLDFMAAPDDGFWPHDASLPALASGRVHRRTFIIRDVVREVAPGVTQRLWTYNGTMPGPVLHGRVGDSFVIHLVNNGSQAHSIDFHAGALAPDGPMRTVVPGESLVYRFRATRAGIWMYHCGTMPMSTHIANGLFGAVVVEPPNLPHADRSYVLVQSELYLGAQGGTVDPAKVEAERPDAVVFNGYANQYDHRALPARVGERVRLWVLDAGPNRASSFHVVGGQFDTVYSEGSYLLRGGAGGSQSLGLQAAQGGFVELTFAEPGYYPFLTHVMVDAERGAHGLFDVTR